MLRVLELENRITPTFGVRDGIVYNRNLGDFVPFEDFLQNHNVAGFENVTVVGAAFGGGPRVQVRDNVDTVVDFFAYEPTFRDGVKVAAGRDFFATGTNLGGGPVVAVFDYAGNEISRFFAYGEDFRGGVSVAIYNDTIYTVPGPGGGPHVRAFDMHGVEIKSFFGANSELREGWEIFVGDVTHDLAADVVLVGNDTITINHMPTYGQATAKIPNNYKLGYEDGGMTAGIGYLRAQISWTGFPTLTDTNVFDSSAGNPNPPATIGFKPGIHQVNPRTSGPVEDDEPRILQELASGVSVGTLSSTGTNLIPFYLNETNEPVALTARHVISNNLSVVVDHHTLYAPGAIDGRPVPVGAVIDSSIILPGQIYTVDAVVVDLVIPHTNTITFRGEALSYSGVDYDPQPDEGLMSVGRGQFIGLGTFVDTQYEPAVINWGINGQVNPLMDGQYIGQRGLFNLSVPGFSGGPCFIFKWSEQGVEIKLLGMVVAGSSQITYITPVALLEQQFNIHA